MISFIYTKEMILIRNNENNEAKEIKLVFDKNSKIKLTGDSYISELEDTDTSYSNIDLNGYKLYVGGKKLKK